MQRGRNFLAKHLRCGLADFGPDRLRLARLSVRMGSRLLLTVHRILTFLFAAAL